MTRAIWFVAFLKDRNLQGYWTKGFSKEYSKRHAFETWCKVRYAVQTFERELLDKGLFFTWLWIYLLSLLARCGNMLTYTSIGANLNNMHLHPFDIFMFSLCSIWVALKCYYQLILHASQRYFACHVGVWADVALTGLERTMWVTQHIDWSQCLFHWTVEASSCD